MADERDVLLDKIEDPALRSEIDTGRAGAGEADIRPGVRGPVSIIDPHSDHLADARAKLNALAHHAELHGYHYVRVGSISGAAHPEVVAALESYSIAWKVACEVAADDVDYVAGRATAAVEAFVRLDGELPDIAEDPHAIQPE